MSFQSIRASVYANYTKLATDRLFMTKGSFTVDVNGVIVSGKGGVELFSIETLSLHLRFAPPMV